jgi:glycosyltransferase involved in cell wall biosynthesis
LKIIFLNRYFHPDHSATSQILSDLAFALAAQGYAVHVVSSRQGYESRELNVPGRETIAGVETHRVWTSRFGRENLAGRAVDYATFYLTASAVLWQLASRNDVIVAKTDPPLLSVVAAPIVRSRGGKLVNWLQDLFPEVAEVLGVGGRVSRTAYRLMSAIRNRSLRQASMNVAVGEHMAERLRVLGIAPERIRVIPNWADGDLVEPLSHCGNSLRRDWGFDREFVVGYSGNLGRAHEFATFLDAIEQLERRNRTSAAEIVQSGELTSKGSQPCSTLSREPKIVWLFIGGGALQGAFKREVERRRLTSVKFEPYQPREQLAKSLSVADVHLISLRPELEGLIVPSKFYGIAAAGRPTIFIGDGNGEIARVLDRYGCGITVQTGDGRGLARAIASLATQPQNAREMGRRARQAFEAEFDLPAAVQRWRKMLSEIGPCREHPG